MRKPRYLRAEVKDRDKRLKDAMRAISAHCDRLRATGKPIGGYSSEETEKAAKSLNVGEVREARFIQHVTAEGMLDPLPPADFSIAPIPPPVF